MAERDEPGQVRMHRGFLKAGGRAELWPEGAKVVESHRQKSEIDSADLLTRT